MALLQQILAIIPKQMIVSAVTIFIVSNLMLLSTAYLILLERKIASWVQDRTGPNRVGPLGLLQPIADGLKMFLKEDYTPANVEKVLFTIGPAMAIVPAMMGWAVIPWGGAIEWGGEILQVMAAPINIGVIYILAIGSLAVYGVVVGAYASNNKYSFLGGLRATAQMLSYEIPLGISVLIILLLAGSPRTDYILYSQLGFAGGVWNVFYLPLLAIIFFTCNLAETNRAPFDLAEAEQELVGGYHTEYSSMRFALFFLGEYLHMIAACAFFTLLFLGGWSINPLGVGPELPVVGGIGIALLKFAVFAFKVFLLLSLMMLVRWTLPRFRFDQLMRLAWRSLIPVTLLMLLLTGAVVYLKWTPWVLLLANVLVLVGMVIISPMIPQGPAVNRRIGLPGSRFSPPVATE